MTREEAAAWAAGSSFPTPVFHVTTVAAAASIRTHGFDLSYRAGGRIWGNGVYAAIDRSTRQVYLDQLGDLGIALEVRVAVRRVLQVHVSSTRRVSAFI